MNTHQHISTMAKRKTMNSFRTVLMKSSSLSNSRNLQTLRQLMNKTSRKKISNKKIAVMEEKTKREIQMREVKYKVKKRKRKSPMLSRM